MVPGRKDNKTKHVLFIRFYTSVTDKNYFVNGLLINILFKYGMLNFIKILKINCYEKDTCPFGFFRDF